MAVSSVKANRGLNLVDDQDTGIVQSQIKKVSSDTFMWLALGSIVGSLALKSMGRRDDSLFVGQWAPTFAIIGVFDKILRAVRT